LPRLSFVRKYSGKIFRENIPGKYSGKYSGRARLLGKLRQTVPTRRRPAGAAATDAPPPHRRGARLLGELRQRFPETSFHIDGTSGIDGSGRWTGSDHARVVWTNGPTKTTISTVVTARRAHSNRPQLSLTSLTKLDLVSEVSRAIEPCRVKQSKKRNRTRRGEVDHTR
jgi:hypothetical protein